jgi:hypothetical protein
MTQAASTSTFKQFLQARNGLPLTRPYTPQLIGSACESWEQLWEQYSTKICQTPSNTVCRKSQKNKAGHISSKCLPHRSRGSGVRVPPGGFLWACGVVFPFAISTSICRSSAMICSGL